MSEIGLENFGEIWKQINVRVFIINRLINKRFIKYKSNAVKSEMIRFYISIRLKILNR
jgi:hypothetical protein